METILGVVRSCASLLHDGWNFDWTKLRFIRGDEAILTALVLSALAAGVLLVKQRSKIVSVRSGIILPALLPSMIPGPGRHLRLLPAALAIAGLIFLLIALADPYITFIKQDATNPGRRILMLLDASGSMGGGSYENRFRLESKLNARSIEPFYTAAAAAQYFIRQRMKSGYRDLIGLIEFGDESYIVSPFNADYENVLMSVRLLSEPEEYRRFKDAGTKISQAIHQAVNLFKTFDFLKASGNLIVLFSDGEDNQVEFEGRKLDDILAESSKNKVPVFFIRTMGNKPLGHPATNDDLWGAAVAKTGGKLYAGANADVIVQACDEINKIAAGRIQYTRYSARSDRFQSFALVAALLWSLALALWLGLRFFRQFP